MNFDRISAELNIELPKFYKESILDYPFTALDELDFVEENLERDIEWILESNIELRENGFFGQSWPKNYFAIGHDGFGNYVFLSLIDNDKKIYFVDHDFLEDINLLEELEYAPSMEEYIEMCKEDQIEILGDDIKNI